MLVRLLLLLLLRGSDVNLLLLGTILRQPGLLLRLRANLSVSPIAVWHRSKLLVLWLLALLLLVLVALRLLVTPLGLLVAALGLLVAGCLRLHIETLGRVWALIFFWLRVTGLGELVVGTPFNIKPVLVKSLNIVAQLDVFPVFRINVLNNVSALPVKIVENLLLTRFLLGNLIFNLNGSICDHFFANLA